jgi:hypothetical protein
LRQIRFFLKYTDNEGIIIERQYVWWYYLFLNLLNTAEYIPMNKFYFPSELSIVKLARRFSRPASLLFLFIFILALFIGSNTFSQGKIIMNGAAISVQNLAYVTTGDISVSNTSTVTINNSTIQISGALTNSGGVFDVTNGTVNMNGSVAQTIPNAAFYTNKILNLIISNNVTLAGQDSLTGILSFGPVNSKTFTTGGYLTLKSTSTKTAKVADITNGNVNTGNVVSGNVHAERYLAALKKWRLLSIPTTTTQNIIAAWQEGCGTNANCLPGYGTQITGSGGTSAGFDVYTASPSMKTYITATNYWVGVPSTNGTQINNVSNNTIAYFLFVRGDRSVTSAFGSPTYTNLRTYGPIKQGSQAAITIASPATAYTAVGNPYPSEIDLRNMNPSPSASTKIYVWDAASTIGSVNGYGAYQTLTYSGGTFTATPGGGTFGAPYNQNPNYIESGQAFLVGGNASSYNINFAETIKSSGSSTGYLLTPEGMDQDLTANLYTVASGDTTLMDGAREDIGSQYCNCLDDDDAYKILNSGENVSFERDGALLSVERHYTINDKDTFYLTIGNMRMLNYLWQIHTDNLDLTGLNGWLIDSFTNTTTQLIMNGNTYINFSANSTPGSYAPNRFNIVFTPAGVMAVTYSSVEAFQKNGDIEVEWQAQNEQNLKIYEVQVSPDGTNYESAYTVQANNLPISNYSWLDVTPYKGYNYFRIRSTDLNGKVVYSKVVTVLVPDANATISIYPNPVKNGIINLQMTNQPAGNYGIRLFNKLGQVIISKQISHPGGTGTELIQLNKFVAKGIYQLEVTKTDGSVITMDVIE